MRLIRYDDARRFYDRAEPFLLVHEAEHCLIIGICQTLIQQPGHYTNPYLALVEDGDETVAVTLRTPPFNLVLSLIPDERRVPEALALIARDVFALYPDLPGVAGPAALSLAFAGEWQRRTGQRYRISMNERLYRLDRVIPVSGVAGALRRATAADREVVVRWMGGFFRDAFGEGHPESAEGWVADALTSPIRAAYLWDDGEPVSLVAYGGPTPHGNRIGPVYTPPELRGHGYASAATAAVTQMLLDSGRQFCFLFTDLSNPTSNSIYQKIGYQSVLDVDMYEFTTEAT